jgi:aldehyde dehydrogenase (NAD+)
MATAHLEGQLEAMRLAQREWAETPLRARVSVVRRLRRRAASAAQELAETVPLCLLGALNRTLADTLVSEVLPLLKACQFLERDAAAILKTRRLNAVGGLLRRRGVDSRVERAPLGIVLVLGAANYPLFLAGVQVLQALVAGNAVLWKPAPGTEAPAFALKTLLAEAGLRAELLTVLDSSVEAANEAIAGGVDHVVLTGSAETGKAVLRQLAETLTPATMELSGCDAVFVLPDADVAHTIQALTFGLRLNGSCTCMAPRRVFLVGMAEEAAARFEAALTSALSGIDEVPIPARTEKLLRDLISDARSQGAQIVLDGLDAGSTGATLILGATPAMQAMQADVFAPVMSVMRAEDAGEALAANAACAYGLTASIFGSEGEARRLAERLRVGHVLINDVIIPTIDPRVPFGGRGRSGFGVTRGAEGLLAMTTPRTVQVQRGWSKRSYEPTGAGHVALFSGLAALLHGDGFRKRWDGLKRLVAAARKLG